MTRPAESPHQETRSQTLATRANILSEGKQTNKIINATPSQNYKQHQVCVSLAKKKTNQIVFYILCITLFTHPESLQNQLLRLRRCGQQENLLYISSVSCVISLNYRAKGSLPNRCLHLVTIYRMVHQINISDTDDLLVSAYLEEHE